MYKKYVSSIVLLLMVTGCSSSMTSGNQKEEPLSVRGMATNTSQLVEKAVELSVDLIHPTTQEILHSFTPKINPKPEEYVKELNKLADGLADKLDQPMIPVKLSNGQLTNGQSRVVLDEEKLVESLKNVRALDKTIALPLQEESPNVTQETIKGIDEIVIGSYKTTFNANVWGRTENIALSANTINQIVLGPGDRFYFNLVVGERTPARGYQKAKEIVNKEFVEGIGGGICQTSSTLYNAVAEAGLEILELHSHSLSVGYVPAGRDATVSWGGPDFKFMNNKDYPVMIKTIVNKSSGSIEVQILASKQAAAKI
ncbi:VanW family protein [Metabacillus bambusae]|uniref:VanW family protein n=1 Tax=Metabacillus bambusae TaxID=2795218 RepID=A0ABS3N216_9BACI|nr:VanW family protein [Metabacillus bambusae]MBO1512095.1 VanW family protein [Metabacillus bambusae]